MEGRCPPACPRTSVAGTSLDCPPPRAQYKGTLDVMRRVAHEVVIIILPLNLLGLAANADP